MKFKGYEERSDDFYQWLEEGISKKSIEKSMVFRSEYRQKIDKNQRLGLVTLEK